MALKHLLTQWANQPEIPLPEYPRPQMRRENWCNLNGSWEYAFTRDETPPEKYDGNILVPFSPESVLSGVNRQLQPDEVLHYRRIVRLQDWENNRIRLHFGAVDQTCTVYWNGQCVASHTGGYLPFWADVTDYARVGDNVLQVVVRDVSDSSCYTVGKQRLQRGGIFYTAQSGIWQTVWYECVPPQAMQTLQVVADADTATIRIKTDSPLPLSVDVRLNGQTVANGNGNDGMAIIQCKEIAWWSPDQPTLYDLEIVQGEDRVQSYCAFRTIARAQIDGVPTLLLNGKPYCPIGLLDQGYYSDGLYTPPSDQAMISDILRAKEMGFDLLRKHIKIEPLRWYYHCDRLGMLVWQDMVSGGYAHRLGVSLVRNWLGKRVDDTRGQFGRTDAVSKWMYEEEMQQTIALLANTPSIVGWCLFNESWGQFDAVRITQLARQADATRLLDSTSGWHDQGVGDCFSRHLYVLPLKSYRRKRRRDKRLFVYSEIGGYARDIDGHRANPDKLFGYAVCRNDRKLEAMLDNLYDKQLHKQIKCGLQMIVYTQLSDVEDEINGLITYDRAVVKVDIARMQERNRRIREQYQQQYSPSAHPACRGQE